CSAVRLYSVHCLRHILDLHSFPTRRSSDLSCKTRQISRTGVSEQDHHLSAACEIIPEHLRLIFGKIRCRRIHQKQITVLGNRGRSEEHTSELQSRFDLVCRLLLEKKKKTAA